VALTYTQTPGNGLNRLFSVSFPYLLRAHIRVFLGYDVVAGTGTELVNGTGFSWLSDTQIQTTTAPAFGKTVTVIRRTPSGAQLVAYATGSPPTPDDLNTANLQSLYVIQEQADLAAATAALAANNALAVANALPYQPIATVANIPAAPANGQRIEISNSTGIESFLFPLTGMPSGFVGAPSLITRLVYTITENTWQWVDYRAADPDARYRSFNRGAGAIPRTVYEKLAEREVSVLDYPTLQAAVDAVLPRGRIMFPEGFYDYNQTISVDGAGDLGLIEFVGLGGSGGGSVLRLPPGFVGTALFDQVDAICTWNNLTMINDAGAGKLAINAKGGINNGYDRIIGNTFVGFQSVLTSETDSYQIADNYAINCTDFVTGQNAFVNTAIHGNYAVGGRRAVFLRQNADSPVPQQTEGIRIFNNTFLCTQPNATAIEIQCGLQIDIFHNVIDQTGDNGIGIYMKPFYTTASSKPVTDRIRTVNIISNWIDAGGGTSGGCVYGDGTQIGTALDTIRIKDNTFRGGESLSTDANFNTFRKPVVYLNGVNSIWLRDNDTLSKVSSGVQGFQLVNCYNVRKTDNTHLVTNPDTSITRNYYDTAPDFSDKWEVVVNGVGRLRLGPTGNLYLKSATGSEIAIIPYSGNPEGNVQAGPGSLCPRTDIGKLYVKEGTGTGTTGWVLK
jgi:hypothetical protein